MTSLAGESMLVTGAAGRLGCVLRPTLRAAGCTLRLTDRRTVRDLQPGESFFRARLGSRRAMRRACRGIGAILHLGGVATEQSWAALTEGNVTGLVTLLEAARDEGVPRFVFASTMHVLGLYARTEPITETSEVRPDTGYASSKVFGEAACRHFAGKHGMAVTIVRIGHVVPTIDAAPYGQSISENDLGRLLLLALGQVKPGVRLFHAVAPQHGDVTSDGRLEREHGFQFADPGLDAAAAAAAAHASHSLGTRGRIFRGGSFADIP